MGEEATAAETNESCSQGGSCGDSSEEMLAANIVIRCCPTNIL